MKAPRTVPLTPARRATGVLRELGIRLPSEIDVEAIAAHFGCFVRFRHLEGQEGHLLRTARAGLIVVSEAARKSKKWRFIIAHELGHYLHHEGLDQFALCTDRDLHAWYETSGHEDEANRFASELLMPEWLFRPRCHREQLDLHLVRELAAQFDTSMSATSLRLVKLTGSRCAVAYSEAGRICWWAKSKHFPFFLRKGERVGRRTVATALFDGVSVSENRVAIGAEEWSGDSRADGLELAESSARLGSHGVLSLLVAPAVGDEEAEAEIEDATDFPFQ